MGTDRNHKSGARSEKMNIFRLCGDMSHLFAMLILLMKVWKTRSVSGVSAKSQALFFMVFATRYVDLFTSYISAYNTSMKCLFLFISFLTVYFCYIKFRSTYNEEGDKFRIEFILVPAVGLAFLVHHDFSSQELLWTFSIYLEAVAIMPQLQMIAETGAAGCVQTVLYMDFFYLYITKVMYGKKLTIPGG